MTAAILVLGCAAWAVAATVLWLFATRNAATATRQADDALALLRDADATIAGLEAALADARAETAAERTRADCERDLREVMEEHIENDATRILLEQAGVKVHTVPRPGTPTPSIGCEHCPPGGACVMCGSAR